MRLFTAGGLILAAKELIDAENQNNIADTVWRKWLSSCYARLHGAVAETGFRYFEDVESYTTDGVESLYDLPTDHLATTTVVRVVAPDDRRPLQRMPAQLQVQMVSASGAPTGSEATHYAEIGQELWFGPQKPPAGQVYELRFIPNAPDLSLAADGLNVDVATPDGESFVLHGMAVLGLMKQERDPRDHARERDLAEQRLRSWASMRAYHERHVHVTSRDALGSLDPGEYRDRSGW